MNSKNLRIQRESTNIGYYEIMKRISNDQTFDSEIRKNSKLGST